MWGNVFQLFGNWLETVTMDIKKVLTKPTKTISIKNVQTPLLFRTLYGNQSNELESQNIRCPIPGQIERSRFPAIGTAVAAAHFVPTCLKAVS
jgi:hypothetical protein